MAARAAAEQAKAVAARKAAEEERMKAEERARQEAVKYVLNTIKVLKEEINSLNTKRERDDLKKEPPDITEKLSTLTSNIKNLNNKLTEYKNNNIEFSQYIKIGHKNLINSINSLLISHNINRIQFTISPESSPEGAVGNIKSVLETPYMRNRLPVGESIEQAMNSNTESTQIKKELEWQLNQVNTFNFDIQDNSPPPTPEKIIRQTKLITHSPPSSQASRPPSPKKNLGNR